MKLLYKNQANELNMETFRNPPKEYRGTPFWAWNTALDKEVLSEQISMFKKMGMGGYHVHVRTGLETPYLSDEFMDFVCHSVNEGKENDLLTWLYDEDRWPSGAAGGRVTAGHPELSMMNLMWTPNAYGTVGPIQDLGIKANGRCGNREENGVLLGVFDVQLSSDGTLLSYCAVDQDASVKGCKWYAYAERAVSSAWYNNQTYIDTMNKAATQRFIEITYERYKEVLGQEFGGAIPAIFTDEPGYVRTGVMDYATDKKDIFIPWTEALEEIYAQQYGESLIAHLPELFWELPEGELSLTRYQYHELVTELFTSNHLDTLGNWCDKNGIILTGHLLQEETLESQTRYIGEAIRGYRAFRHIPGIDILRGGHEYNTAKQAQSAKHQHGSEAMLSELYGISGWDYDFRGFKLQGDWQAALGVTVRVPHLTWMSMKGESKRDFPTDIGYQSPWWDQFSLIEDYFARVNTVMTRGKAEIRVAVIHPIESFWLYWGPSENTAVARTQMEEHFASLTETLLFNNIDFDFISESRLPELCVSGGNPLRVGEMEYDYVIVPDCRTLRATTLQRLEDFSREGGTLIFLSSCPDHVDAKKSSAVQQLYARSCHASYSPSDLLDVLEEARQLDIRGAGGARTNYLLHQMRVERDHRWLFIARGKNPRYTDLDEWEPVRIRIRGEWRPTVFDALTGDVFPITATFADGWTEIRKDWHDHDSLLLKLEPGRATSCGSDSETEMEAAPLFVPPLAEFITHEPNVLLLDRAQWAFDDGLWHPTEELLRIDNLCREALNIPLRARYVVQPYMLKPEKTEHHIRLRFAFQSQVEIFGAKLALEDAEDAVIMLNGEVVPSITDGFYVDKAIQCVRIPVIQKGMNVLELKTPIGRRTNLEWCYLLGEFGVQLYGTEAVLTQRPAMIGYGSIVNQGFPFYTGNFTYRFEIEGEGKYRIRVPKYRAALLKVCVDGCEIGKIAFAPYSIETGSLPAGKHTVEITCYGTRQNGFGQVHHEQGVFFSKNPDSWRSKGDLWLDEYQLLPSGVLKKVEIIRVEKNM